MKSSLTTLTTSLEKIQGKAYLQSKGISPNSPFQLDLLFPAMCTRSDLRHIPNDYARSSLFTVRNKNIARKSFLHEELFHYNSEIRILYTGIELRAEDDELVWLQILHYGQSVELGTPFDFSVKDLVRDVGWHKNGYYYNKARESISRLKANEVLALNSKAYGKSGAVSLIKNYISVNDSDGNPTRYKVEIDPSLILLFAGNTFTSHKWTAYLKLSPVARRLADYVESHKYPFPLSIKRFRSMCGSSNVNLGSWRQTVARACFEIEREKICKYAILKDDSISCVV